MASQTDINNVVNTIVNNYTGRLESYHGGYDGAAIVPVNYYIEVFIGTNVPYGWDSDFPTELVPYFTDNDYIAGTVYPKGTILVWDNLHVGIVLHSDGGNTVEVFEQNADPDNSPCHCATRLLTAETNECLYAFIPIVTATVETFTPPVVETPQTVNIAPPLRAPSTTDTIQLLTEVPRYNSFRDALEQKNPVDTFTPNKYFVFKRLEGMLSLTLQLGVPSGYWINPVDLEPRVETDWRELAAYPKPQMFKALADALIIDMEGTGKQLSIREGQPILIAGFFRAPDGNVYGAPHITYSREPRQWYGLPKELLRLAPVVRSLDATDQLVETPLSPMRARIYALLDKTNKQMRRLIQ